MRLPSSVTLTPADTGPHKTWSERLVADAGSLLAAIVRVLNGHIGFGDGTDIDNIKGQWVTVTSHATPGTEFAVAHGLGEVPIGFLLMVPPAAGYVTKGTTAWTTSNIYLTVVGAGSQALTLFVLLSSQGSE